MGPEVEGHDKRYVKTKVEVAHRLIANGMTVEEAAEIAGVDVELVRGLGLKVIIQDLTPTTFCPF
jgi:hypothetical protein